VYIKQRQYFEDVRPQVLAFQGGGYQVLAKWLKDRKGRKLSWTDAQAYAKIVVALRETIRLMEGIDRLIPAWPLP
jgi:hypothetical protein